MICLPELSEFSVGSKNGSLFRNSTIFSSGNFLRKCPYHLIPFQNCWNFWSNGKGPTSHFQLCFISWRKRSNKVLWHSTLVNCDTLTEKGVNQEMCEQIRARICVAFVHDWLEFLIHIQKIQACAKQAMNVKRRRRCESKFEVTRCLDEEEPAWSKKEVFLVLQP